MVVAMLVSYYWQLSPWLWCSNRYADQGMVMRRSRRQSIVWMAVVLWSRVINEVIGAWREEKMVECHRCVLATKSDGEWNSQRIDYLRTWLREARNSTSTHM